MVKHYKRDMEMKRRIREANNHARKVMTKASRLANSPRMEHYRAHMLEKKMLQEGMKSLHPSQFSFLRNFVPYKLIKKLYNRQQKEKAKEAQNVIQPVKEETPGTEGTGTKDTNSGPKNG